MNKMNLTGIERLLKLSTVGAGKYWYAANKVTLRVVKEIDNPWTEEEITAMSNIIARSMSMGETLYKRRILISAATGIAIYVGVKKYAKRVGWE